jgi:ferredoxin
MKACPEIFELTDEDLLIVHQDKFTDALSAKITAAVQYCPRGALRLDG